MAVFVIGLHIKPALLLILEDGKVFFKAVKIVKFANLKWRLFSKFYKNILKDFETVIVKILISLSSYTPF